MSAGQPGQRIAIAVDAPAHAGLATTLDYVCERPLAPGTLVQVPLGRRTVSGIVWRRPAADGAEVPAAGLRAVAEVIDALPPLSDAWMRLVEFAAGYYQRSVGEIALSSLPRELRKLGNAQLGKRLQRLHAQAVPCAAAGAQPALNDEQAAPSTRSRARLPTMRRRPCCRASPAAARPRSICAAPPWRCRPAARCWCWCPRST